MYDVRVICEGWFDTEGARSWCCTVDSHESRMKSKRKKAVAKAGSRSSACMPISNSLGPFLLTPLEDLLTFLLSGKYRTSGSLCRSMPEQTMYIHMYMEL